MPLHTDHNKNDSYWQEYLHPCQFDHYNTSSESDTETDTSSDESWGSSPGAPSRAQPWGESRSPSPPGDQRPVVAAVNLEDDRLVFLTEWLERRFNYLGSLEFYFRHQRRDIDHAIAIRPVKDTLTCQWDMTVGLSTKTAYAFMPGTSVSYEDFFFRVHSRELNRPYLEMVELSSGIFRPAELLVIDRDTPHPQLTHGPPEAA